MIAVRASLSLSRWSWGERTVASTQDSSNRSAGRLWASPLFVIAAISILGAVTGWILSVVNGSNTGVTIFSNMTTLLASSLISFLFTAQSERNQFSKDIEKFADFSRRRMTLLANNLGSLTIEIKSIETNDETKRLVSYTLRNLSQDARASVRDIEEMSGLLVDDGVGSRGDSDEPDATSVDPEANPIPAEGVLFSCMSCGHSASIELGIQPGSTRHTVCTKCKSRLSVHRLSGGTYKVVLARRGAENSSDDLRKRLSPYADKTEANASLSSRAPPSVRDAVSVPAASSTEAKEAAVPEPEPLEAVQDAPDTDAPPTKINGFFPCARCSNKIVYKALSNSTEVRKPCFSCFGVNTLDMLTGQVSVDISRRPVYIPTLDIPDMSCRTCQSIFKTQKFRAGDNGELICCFQCNTIYLAEKDKKTSLLYVCPTSGCNNSLRFKFSEAKPVSRQFCFECFKRYSYDGRTQIVEFVEDLSVPALTVGEFEASGSTCPHCSAPSAGRYSLNSRDQRLSVCWSCKNIFELKVEAQPLEKPRGWWRRPSVP